ncbi:hypothetical protein NADFUDRAFT_84526 [Nadsonia fulvescens var. elongata DSM 6958]|uniref:Chitin synthase export chaperone n=1 Tax=Nadsonia fulvescens var. elongata DSM 6958 TaxID=857566 RepID=A0A1E3PEU0_9ASCO|nr:hypothetical protein NADFUDRAFT_84526 [Nadsonia fulvescens var. elongata DSM 6958]
MAFGDFELICSRAAMPLCPLLGGSTANGVIHTGILTQCYARSIELANTVIFQVGAGIINIGSYAILGIMIYNIRSKYTAIGRKEILRFFYLYTLLNFMSLIIDTGVVPVGTRPYPYFVAIHLGITSAVCWSLMINGFLGFQFYEDGTRFSLALLDLSTLASFVLTFVISLVTFQSWGGSAMNSTNNTTGLFVVAYLLNAIFVFIYCASQVFLVIFTLGELWPLGAIGLGLFFFCVGQVLLYGFSSTICSNVHHYLDGIFFATVCNTFAVMMIYKFWDMITKEDLEFSVSTKENPWEVQEYLEDHDTRYDNGSDYAGSTYNLNSHAF